MRKLLSVFLVSCIVALCVVPAFAVGADPLNPDEVITVLENPVTDDPAGSDAVVGDPVTVATEDPETVAETTTEDPVEGEETVVEDPLAVSENGDVPTVNISDESIMAIAEAVATSASQWVSVKRMASDGTTIYVPLSDETYPYIFAWIVGNDLRIYMSSEPLVAKYNSYYGTYQLDGQKYFVYDNTGNYGLGKSYGYPGASYTGTSPYGSGIYEMPYYSNYDIYTSSGDMVWEKSPVVVNVSFDTGFDDLTFETQVSDNLILPSPTKSGWAFLGWYLDPEYTIPYTSDYVFVTDTTLYAKWEEVPPMVSASQNVFDSLTVFLQSEPIFYIVSLLGLVLVIACIKTLIVSRI